jgi:hypothetical protein
LQHKIFRKGENTMSEDATKRMAADAELTRQINAAKSPDEIRDILHAAVERSTDLNLTRDRDTGQFVRRETPAQNPPEKQEPTEEKKFTKTIEINGTEFTFEGATELEVETAVRNAYEIASVFERHQQQSRVVEPTNLDGIADPIKRAVAEIMVEQGFNPEVQARAQDEQYMADWASATQVFLNGPLGSSWPGGQKNLEIISMTLQKLGLTEAEDKVAALGQAYAEMKQTGTLFSGDVTAEQVNEMTKDASPVEILEAWKAAQPNSESANKSFIESFRNGRSSGIFAK